MIESWDPVDDISEMPEDELCSYCLGAKLRMMQESAYSAYDDLYAERLEYINESKFTRMEQTIHDFSIVPLTAAQIAEKTVRQNHYPIPSSPTGPTQLPAVRVQRIQLCLVIHVTALR